MEFGESSSEQDVASTNETRKVNTNKTVFVTYEGLDVFIMALTLGLKGCLTIVPRGHSLGKGYIPGEDERIVGGPAPVFLDKRIEKGRRKMCETT